MTRADNPRRGAARRVLIVDDHEVTRRGLRELLIEALPEAEVQEAASCMEMEARLKDGPWHLLVLDLLLPDRSVLELLARVSKEARRTPVLVLTAIPEAEYVAEALRAGVLGYIHKNRASEELVRAVSLVLEGEVYLDSEGARAMAEVPQLVEQLPHQSLSPRELQVFLLLAGGRSIKETALDLSLSHKTVSTYLTRIRDKTGLLSLVDIARYALRHRLVR